MPLSFPWKKFPLKKFITSDDATLYYYHQYPKKKNLGQILIMCGWSQTPDGFSPMLTTNKFIRDHYEVYILVMRGWNLEYISYGNAINRYAMDVKEFIKCKIQKKVITCTHSMGCAIVWRMIELFGEDMFLGYFIIDQGPVLTKNPLITDDNIYKEQGSILTSQQIYETCAGLNGPDGDVVRASFVLTMFTDNFKLQYPDIVEKVIKGGNNYNLHVASNVFFEHCANNNIDQILCKKIKKPTFLIGGKVSIVPYQSMEYQQRYYKCADVFIFSQEQGGSHFMFIENYTLINEKLNNFLKKIC